MLPKPVIEVPGYTPRSPLIVVGFVLVTVEEPKTVKLCADPSIGAAGATEMNNESGTKTLNLATHRCLIVIDIYQLLLCLVAERVLGVARAGQLSPESSIKAPQKTLFQS
jgi:hypothetical protein